MTGLFAALLSGFSFALGNIFIRRGVYKSGESFTPVPIALFLGTLLFGFAFLISGETDQLASLSWLGAGSLAGAGILHYYLGRQFGYISIRLIGANRAAPIQMCSIPLAALIGVLFLGEPFSASLVIATLLVVGGVILISTSYNPQTEKSGIPGVPLAKGVVTSLATALCWGSSPMLVKIGLQEISSPILASFISYIAASVLIGASFLYPNNVEKLRSLNRTSLFLFILAGIATSVSALTRYIALDYSPVSLVVPLTATHGLFIFPLSFIVNRKIEAFNLRIVLGAIAVLVGIFLIFWIA
jgi:drug/metabolite transporter (DMT)-like permease